MKKKLLTFLMLGVLGLSMMVSCGSNSESTTSQAEEKSMLKSSVSSIAIDENGAEDSVVIIGANGECRVLACPSWMNITLQDTVVKYKVGINSDSVAKEGCLLVQSGDSRVMIPVVQGIKPTFLMVSEKKVTMDRDGDTINVAVATDGVKVNVESFPEVTAILDGECLTLTSKKNEGKLLRGTVKIVAGEHKQEVVVIIDGDVCPTCKGTGTVKCSKCNGEGGYFSFEDMWYYGCRSCGGNGRSYRVEEPGFRQGSGRIPCPTCKGKK